jgi:hypothetical protein
VRIRPEQLISYNSVAGNLQKQWAIGALDPIVANLPAENQKGGGAFWHRRPLEP